ncbi:hypothetical protein AVEN_194936-1 [Araneus ventricosus]|uniref:Uncharacterized protein n=1 Tax=Araneus ventricosus TaxID=182803 RepID=A0A4Y2EXS7_ARAVE|nr:hypothetical protein AVEN_194936-1 [Araneus ventricosus]
MILTLCHPVQPMSWGTSRLRLQAHIGRRTFQEQWEVPQLMDWTGWPTLLDLFSGYIKNFLYNEEITDINHQKCRVTAAIEITTLKVLSQNMGRN